MNNSCFRFCPECGSRVAGPPEAFARPRICPKCRKKVSYADYPWETVGSFLPPAIARLSWGKQFVRGSGLVMGMLGVANIYALCAGNRSATFWFAHALAMFAMLVLTRHARMQRERDLLQQSLKNAERALIVNKSQLEAAESVNRGFKKNFNKLINQAKSELLRKNRRVSSAAEKKLAEADRIRRSAENQRQIVKTLTDRLLHNEVEYLVVGDPELTFDQALRHLETLIQFCREHDGHISLLREEELCAELRRGFDNRLRRQQEQNSMAQTPLRHRMAELARRKQDE